MKVDAENMSDPELDALERLVPGQAREATQSAYARALSVSSQGVLCIEAGNLVRVTRDGGKTVVAKAKPRRRVPVGELIIVRRVEGQAADGHA